MVGAAVRLFPGLTIERIVALQRRFNPSETYLKQFDHVIAGLRLEGRRRPDRLCERPVFARSGRLPIEF
jgi:hypothetical protein